MIHVYLALPLICFSDELGVISFNENIILFPGVSEKLA